MRNKKSEQRGVTDDILNGQIWIWNLPSVETSKKDDSISTNTCSSFNTRIQDIPEEQQEIYNKFLLVNSLNRIVLCGGLLAIETKHDNDYKTSLYNKEGKLEIEGCSKVRTLPFDKILVEKTGIIKAEKDQVDKLHEYLCKYKYKIKRIIKRKGDYNFLIETDNKIVCITPHPWILEYNSISKIECTQDEVYLIPVKSEIKSEDMLDPKVGDMVQAYRKKGEIIEGQLTHLYNGGITFNIAFDNNTKMTAIPRTAIIKVIR